MKTAGLGYRFWSGLISAALFLPCLIIAALVADSIVSNLLGLPPGQVPADGPQASAAVFLFIIVSLVLIPLSALVYGLIGLLLGKSPGQAILKISIWRAKGERAGFTGRLRRYLIIYGWAVIMMSGTLLAIAIQKSVMAGQGDFFFNMMFAVLVIAVLWVAISIIEPLISAMADRGSFLIDKFSGTLPVVKQWDEADSKR